MAKATAEIEIAVKAAVVNPGDTLILIARDDMTDAAKAALERSVEQELPGIRCGVIRGIDQALVYKPSDGAGCLPDPRRSHPGRDLETDWAGDR